MPERHLQIKCFIIIVMITLSMFAGTDEPRDVIDLVVAARSVSLSLLLVVLTWPAVGSP